MDSPANDHPRVIAQPMLLWLIGVVISFLLHFLVFAAPLLPQAAIAFALGVACILAGLFLVAQARAAMHAAGTNVYLHQPTLTIVRRGPYRFTRNPMYLALCLLQAGIGFLFNDWIALSIVVPLVLVLHFGVILREEKYLTAKFGDTYLDLTRHVRRWI